jgi:hypothetical protein
MGTWGTGTLDNDDSQLCLVDLWHQGADAIEETLAYEEEQVANGYLERSGVLGAGEAKAASHGGSLEALMEISIRGRTEDRGT